MFADLISLSRILLAYPLYQALVVQDHVASSSLILWMLVSDMIDGGIARYYGMSLCGKWLDPLADAVAIGAAIIALLHMKIIGWFWIIFWLIRYAFFAIFAVWVLYKKGYCIEAGICNKISIALMVCFLINAWYVHHVSYILGIIVIVIQLISIVEILYTTARYQRA